MFFTQWVILFNRMEFQKNMATLGDDWCIVHLGEDYNWWVTETAEKIHFDPEFNGILDPKQIEKMADLLSQLREYGLKSELLNNAFALFTIDKELPKQSFRLRLTSDDIFNPKEPIFCLPVLLGDQDGPYMDFLDHITALRVKLLNASFDFQQPIDIDEIEDVLHADQQERFISGVKVHPFDEILSVLEFVPLGYNLDNEIDDEEKNSDEDDLNLSDFNDEVDDSFEGDSEATW